MNTPIDTLREKLHHYIDIAGERKVQAMYVMLEEEIEYVDGYTEAFKKELDKRYTSYKKDGKVITEKEAKQRVHKLLQKHK